MKNIFIIGDSLACPRPWIGLGQNATYASLLQKAVGSKAHVINLAGGFRNTRHYANASFIKTNVEQSQTDTMIMQLGIVDCAPRLMTFAERGIGFVCAKTQITNAIFQKYINFKSKHRYFFTRRFPNITVKDVEFSRNIQTIIDSYLTKGQARQVFILNIACPGPHMTERSFGIMKIIQAYNDILAKAAQQAPDRIKIIDVFVMTQANPELITSEDGHHITPRAHQLIAEKIIASGVL